MGRARGIRRGAGFGAAGLARGSAGAARGTPRLPQHETAGRILVQDPPRRSRELCYSVAPQGVTVPVLALTIGVDHTAAGPKSPSPEKVALTVAISVGPR